MSKLMWIAGILLLAAGVALGLMVFASPANIVGWGITPEVAAVLLVGGFISIGLGGVVSAVNALAESRMDVAAYVPQSQAPAAAIPEFGRGAAETAATATAAAPEAPEPSGEAEEISEPVKETIVALEQARQKIEQAFEPPRGKRVLLRPELAPEPASALEPVPPPEPVTPPEPAPAPTTAEAPSEEPAAVEPEPEAAPEAAAEGGIEEGQLYVVEERFIRQRPARILSDGTVEAETDEGWMRFENLEHLDEYLDAMVPPSRG